jgi:hypothetical protein
MPTALVERGIFVSRWEGRAAFNKKLPLLPQRVNYGRASHTESSRSDSSAN